MWLLNDHNLQVNLQVSHLVLDGRAVTAKLWMTPRNNWCVCDCSKCIVCGLNLSHIPKLMLDCRAVATKLCIPPGHNRPICQDCSECGMWGQNLLDGFQWLDFGAVTTPIWMSRLQLSHLPESLQMRTASIGWSWTAKLFPPFSP